MKNTRPANATRSAKDKSTKNQSQRQGKASSSLTTGSLGAPNITILVMGATGTGKSTFINLLSGSKVAVGHGLESCTSEVAPLSAFRLRGKDVQLVDTPGFDDTYISDVDILARIAQYLSDEYKNRRLLAGVIYMHRITDTRVGGTTRRNFRMLLNLCGPDALRNVVIVTNMWGALPAERGEARLKELCESEDFFAPALRAGAITLKHMNTRESAEEIVRHFLELSPRPLRIQQQMVDQGLHISQTDAYVELDRELAQLLAKKTHEIEQVRSELSQASTAKAPATSQDLQQQRDELLRDIEKINHERQKLAGPPHGEQAGQSAPKKGEKPTKKQKPAKTQKPPKPSKTQKPPKPQKPSEQPKPPKQPQQPETPKPLTEVESRTTKASETPPIAANQNKPRPAQDSHKSTCCIIC